MPVKAQCSITLVRTEDGQSVTSVTAEYYVSNSKTEQSGGAWSSAMPNWENNKYLWIRQKIVYKNPDKTEYTVPYVDSSWEKVKEVDTKVDDLKTEEEQKRNELSDLISESTSELYTEINQNKEDLSLLSSNVYTRDDEGNQALQEFIAAYTSSVKLTPTDIELKISNAVNSSLESPKKELKEIATYMNLNEKGVWIGKTDSADNVRMLLQPESLDFVAGTDTDHPLASFTTDGMQTNRGTFSKGLYLGNFGFTVEEDGSLSFGKVK